MICTRVVGGGGLVAAAILALLPAVADATSKGRDQRSFQRCQRAVEGEGLSYVQAANVRLLRCVRATRECELAGGISTAFPCRSSRYLCADLVSDLPGLDQRLRSRVVSACGAVPADQLPEVMDDSTCAVTSADTLAGCLLARLRKQLGDLVGVLEPSTCRLLEQAGIVDRLPSDVCADDGDECPEPPPPGGGLLFCGGPDAVACPEGLACDRRDTLCNDASAPGFCVEMPGTCADEGTPVCGCDGHTYASDCDRLKAGVALARWGSCDPPATACGFGLPACPTGSFCDFPAGDCGEGGTGVCRSMRVEACQLCTAFLPGAVCGCDFVTYANDCARIAAGIPKFFDGSCQ